MEHARLLPYIACLAWPPPRCWCSWWPPCRPLCLSAAVEERLGVVELLMARPEAGEVLQGALAGLPDVERLLPRAAQLFAAVGCGVG